jgi:hypothetical protein
MKIRLVRNFLCFIEPEAVCNEEVHWLVLTAFVLLVELA